jgi:hypothetical protein
MRDDMTARPDEVVAWQKRYIDSDEGAGPWTDCDEWDATLLSDPYYLGRYEVRALVPLASLQSANARLAELDGRVKGLVIELDGVVSWLDNIDADGGQAGKRAIEVASASLTDITTELRRAAAGEGDANQGEVK